MSPYVTPDPAVFRPDAEESPDHPDVAADTPYEVLQNLQKAGYVESSTVVKQTSGETYLSQGRIVTAVNVLRPFVLVDVQYRFSPEAYRRPSWYGRTYADRWEIAERSHIVRTGTYLVVEVGDFVTELAGVAGTFEDASNEDLFYHVMQMEGFAAAHCLAACDRCGTRWSADNGSWRFTPERGTGDSWNFYDAEDIDDDTLQCPACTLGRVGFQIS